MPDNELPNRQLFYTIEILDQAITKGKQVSFHYNEYHTDKKLHPRSDHEGNVRTYIINPYQMAAVNGRYYLICNCDKYDDVSNYRVDRITDIQLLDTPVKPMKNVKRLEHGLNLPKHMAEHVYMLFDWFGKEMQFTDETEDEVTVRVTVNLDAMRKWALQYALHVKVLKPERLVDMLKEDVKRAAEQYEVLE